MNRLRVLLTLTLILCATLVSAFDKKPLTAYSRDIWTTRNGLPHNQVNSTAQTPEGYLWFATWEGLVRYNGQDFRFFTPKNVPELQDFGIRHVSVGFNGRLIVSTSRGGISILEGGNWQTIDADDGLAQNDTMAAVEDNDQNIWVAHESKGISQIMPSGQIKIYDKTKGLPDDRLYTIYKDSNNVIWAGTAKGLVRIENGRVQIFTEKQGLPKGAVYAILQAPEGGLYIGTNQGLYKVQNGEISKANEKFPNEAVISLSVDTEKNLWVGTVNRGIIRMNALSLETLGADQGLPNNRASSLFHDREGNMWVGTGAGLVRFADTPFVTLNNYQGLSDNYVRAIVQQSDNSIMIGTARGLNHYVNGKISKVIGNQSLQNDSILSLAPARDGSLWIGMYSTGLIKWKDGVIVENFDSNNPVFGTQIRAVQEDRIGNVWIGSASGLFKKNGKQVKKITEKDGLPESFIISLFESKSGRIWVGTANGLGFIDGEKAGSIDLAPYTDAKTIFGFSEDADGTLWIATDRSIVRIRDGKIAAVGTKQGMPIATVFQIVIDKYSNFWLTTNRGVFYIKRADLEVVANGKSSQVKTINFAEADGMASAQCNGGAGPGAMRANDGSVWVATAKGVSIVQPDNLVQYQAPPPPVVIETVLVDDQHLNLNKAIKLSSSTRKIEMFYASLSYRTPEQVRFRYRLDGFDNKWVDRRAVRNVQFTNLPPGKYNFEVSASIRGGKWSEKNASLTFVIEPAWYQRIWVITILLVGLFIALYLFYQAHMKNLKAREIELSNIVVDRTRALFEKNTELEAINIQFQQQVEAYAHLASTDALTGLPNRRSMDQKLSIGFKTAVENNQHYCFGLLDVDYFKQVNDKFSHDVGDLALKRIADTMQRIMGELHNGRWRGNDLCARWGGEEFALLFPDQSLESAMGKCEKIRIAIENLDCNDIALGLTLAVSIGVTERTGLSNHEKMVSKADENLYVAKHNGRNQVFAI
jgi:diguanylate cyclase (GGDEF)-like protein